jgi:hypothetical protein
LLPAEWVSVRREHFISFTLWVGAFFGAVALMAAPLLVIEHEHHLLWLTCFLLGVTLMSLCFLVALAAALGDSAERQALGRRHKMTPLIGMVVCGIGLLAFAGWYFWPDAFPAMFKASTGSKVLSAMAPTLPVAGTTPVMTAPMASPSILQTSPHWKPQQHSAPPVTSEIKTNKELYNSDFPNYIKNSTTLDVKGPAEDVVINVTSYFDSFAKSDFISFYIPKCKDPYAISKELADLVSPIVENNKNMPNVRVTVPGDTSPTSSTDSTFSGRVYIYYEDQFVPRQVADLLEVYTAKGYSLQLRGGDYNTAMFLAGRK